MLVDIVRNDRFATIARSPKVSTRHTLTYAFQQPLPSAITPDLDRRCLIRKFRDQTHQARRVIDENGAEERLGLWWSLLQSMSLEALHEAVIIYSDIGPLVSDLLIKQFLEFGDSELECTQLVMSYASFISDLDLVFRLSCRLRFRHILTRLHAIRDRHRPPSIEHAVLDSHLELGRSRAVLATISASGNDPLLFTRYCWRIWSDSWPQLCQIASTDLYPAIPPWIIRDCLGLLPDSSAKQTPDSLILYLHYLHDILHKHSASHKDVDVTEPAIEISLQVFHQYRDQPITANWAAAICDEIIWQPNLFYFNPYSVLERCQEYRSYSSARLALYAFNRDMASIEATLDLALRTNRMDLLTRLAQVLTFSSKEWIYLLNKAPISDSDNDRISLSAVITLLLETVGSVPSLRLLLQSTRVLENIPVLHWFDLFRLSSGPENLNRINCETLILMAEHGGPATTNDSNLKIILKSSECRLCWQELRPAGDVEAEVVVFGCGHGFHARCQSCYPTCPSCLYEHILRTDKEFIPTCDWNQKPEFVMKFSTI